MPRLVRTSILIDKETHEELKKIAKEGERSMSQVARQRIRDGLEHLRQMEEVYGERIR